MKKHVSIYMQHFNYSTADFIPCEVCEAKAVDIHHIISRKMGGDPQGKKDIIENLQALCRKCHNKYGDIPELVEYLQKIHISRMNGNRIEKL